MPNSIADRIRLRFTLLAAVALGACSGGYEMDPIEAREPDVTARAEAVPGEVEVRRLQAESPSGAVLTLALPPELHTGPHTVEVTVPENVDPAGVTADLVSPSMPMHGVTRLTPTIRDGRVLLTLEIPMEGDWALYVNLDGAGVDAAEFLFEVLPHPGAGHGGHAPAA